MSGIVQRAVAWALLLPVVLGLVLRGVRRPNFFERYVGAATPRSLAAVRILTCTVLLAHVAVEDVASTASLPRALIGPMGVLRLLYALPIGFERFLVSPPALSGFKAFTAVLLLAGAVGWHARAVLPLAAVAYLVFGGILRQYSAFYHAGLVPLYVLGVLCFTPCMDAWSMDRASGRRPGPEPGKPAPAYGWSRFACWTVVALAYAASGLSKLRNGGLHWWDPTNIRSIYYRTSLNPMHFDWGLSLHLVRAPDALFAVLGLASVALEVGFAMVLFSRTARRILPLLMIVFHVAVLFLQNLLFLDLVVLQAIFFDFAEPGGLLGPRGAAVDPRPTGGQGDRAGLRYPLLVAGAASALICAWVVRIEFYPLTAMQMFSWRDRSGVVEYYKVLVRRRSGADDPAALRTCTYRTFALTPVVKKAFDPVRRSICRDYLAMCAARQNRRAADPIAHFEIQRWRWDLRDDRTGEHPTLVERYVQDVP
ncbi:MAG: hypothetical protein E6J75_14430 [Deltaproteobacteria bacterium]|nr:MAG: hypothetical protein E6J75_14430 [Deltaproteobacteria bacterium]